MIVMMSKKPFDLGLCIAIIIMMIVGSRTSDAAAPEKSSSEAWTIKQIRILEGFQIPECVCIDPATGYSYVSNIVCPKGVQEKVDARDCTGFISRLAPGGTLDKLRWVESTPEFPLNSTKGMCILGGILYVADLDRVARYDIQTGKPLKPIAIDGALELNDMATDGKHAYVSDTLTGNIHRLCGERAELVHKLAGANGITFHAGKTFVVSVGLHDIFEMVADGAPRPFGLADHFKGLDGIEVLDDDSFLITDVAGQKLFWVGVDRKTVRLLAEHPWPADIGLDRRRRLLFVPLFWDSQVVVYQLEQLAASAK